MLLQNIIQQKYNFIDWYIYFDFLLLFHLYRTMKITDLVRARYFLRNNEPIISGQDIKCTDSFPAT